ncbi:copper-binding protein [Photobacterium sanctipauli]|uniref:Copper-binding protein n=1 Tax=Photobacterium sanctipauli TaxID=1342794 RepID=A0A2T3NRF7_9GAMM|nr:hypothetical protein [Photobacterium sanctipauli]PSW18807.1 copper-binding protein [Photobacterium sanctipauli]
MKKAWLATLLMATSSIALAAGNHDHHHMEGHGEMASAVGMPAPAAQANKTYQVTLNDKMQMNFKPALDIKQSDVVAFVVTNEGKIPHEFSIGSVDEQVKHREMMRAMPDMEHHDGTTLTLQPGQTAKMAWHFMGSQFVEFSCNIPGHFEAGMKRNTLLN